MPRFTSCGMDHSLSCRNAVKNNDEDTALMDCSAHIPRNLRKNACKLHDKDYMETVSSRNYIISMSLKLNYKI